MVSAHVLVDGALTTSSSQSQTEPDWLVLSWLLLPDVCTALAFCWLLNHLQTRYPADEVPYRRGTLQTRRCPADQVDCRQGTLQMQFPADEVHCRRGTLQTRYTADKVPCRRGTLQTRYTADKVPCRRGTLQIRLIAWEERHTPKMATSPVLALVLK